MKKARKLTAHHLFLSPANVLAAGFLLAGAPAFALESLDDGAMSDVSGAGVVFALDDFSFRMAPTSYIELIGSPATGTAVTAGWKRGDARYYGLSMTYGGGCNAGTGPGTGADCVGAANSTGVDWFGNSNTALSVANALQFPMGRKATPGTTNPFGVVGFASVFNPYILRVFQYPGYNAAGTYLNTAANMPTVLEFVGPSKSDTFRWAFWGELEIGRGTAWASSTATSGFDLSGAAVGGGTQPGCLAAGNGNTAYCGLQSQTIILGTATSSGQQWTGTGYTAAPAQRKPAILRLMQTDDTSTGAPAGSKTLGLTYQSSLSGDFRFSVAQTSTPASPNTLHRVPSFNTLEGLHFKNVDAFLPLGYLHYQALIASGVSTTAAGTAFQQNGNFVLELSRIPDVANVYNNFYCGQTTGVVCTQDANGYIAAPNPDTHGYVRWGNWTTSAGGTTQINPAGATGTGAYQLPTATSTANGIYFQNPSGGVTNLGISRVEGLMIQHLKISTLGGG